MTETGRAAPTRRTRANIRQRVPPGSRPSSTSLAPHFIPACQRFSFVSKAFASPEASRYWNRFVGFDTGQADFLVMKEDWLREERDGLVRWADEAARTVVQVGAIPEWRAPPRTSGPVPGDRVRSCRSLVSRRRVTVRFDGHDEIGVGNRTRTGASGDKGDHGPIPSGNRFDPTPARLDRRRGLDERPSAATGIAIPAERHHASHAVRSGRAAPSDSFAV